MANRNFHDMQALRRMLKVIDAKLVVGAAGAITVENNLGVAATVTRNAAGEYTLQLEDSYNELVGCSAILEAAADVDFSFQITGKDLSTAKTVDFNTQVAGVAADLSSGDIIYLTLTFRNTSVVR